MPPAWHASPRAPEEQSRPDETGLASHRRHSRSRCLLRAGLARHRHRVDPLLRRPPRAGEGRAVAQQRGRVCRRLKGGEFEDELRRIEVAADLAAFLGFADRRREQPHPGVPLTANAVLEGAGPGTILVHRPIHHAAAGKRPAIDIAEPAIGQLPKPIEVACAAQGRLHHLLHENVAGGIERGELQCLLVAEENRDIGLSGADARRQAADGQPFQTLDRGDLDGARQDRGARLVAAPPAAIASSGIGALGRSFGSGHGAFSLPMPQNIRPYINSFNTGYGPADSALTFYYTYDRI